MGSRSAACRVAWILAALALSPGIGRAQPRLSLQWDAPPACPDRAAVEAEVARLLGGAMPNGTPAITAEGRAVALDGAFALTLRTEVEGARGERALRGERCEELAAAAALILALMIDPDAVAHADPSPLAAEPASVSPPDDATEEPSPARRLTAPTVRVPREAASREPAPPPERGLQAILGVGALLDVGTLASATPGVQVEGGLGVPLVDARLRAVLLFPQATASAEELPGANAELMALSLGLVGCVRPIDVARFLGVCAELAGGALFGSSRGISDPAFGAGFWLAAGGGVALAWEPAPWFDLEVMAEVLGQIVAPTFDVTVSEAGTTRTVTLFVPGAVSGRFGASAHVRF